MADEGWSVTGLFSVLIFVKIFYEGVVGWRQISSNQEGGWILWVAIFAKECWG
jgi:hypothetical protein